MPLYEYSCQSCGHRFEVLRSLSQADDPVSCPSCSQSARRQMSRFASFVKGADGSLSPVAGGGPSCGGCSATDCSTCSI